MLSASTPSKNIETFSVDSYTIDDDSKERVYRKGLNLKNTHWGQLKLFTNELLFLVNYYDNRVNQVVYIGAAPGEHMVVLADLFPAITFHLYDKSKFDHRLDEKPNVRIYSRYFLNSDVEEWKQKQCLLICDIRTLTYDSSKTNIKDMKINEDTVWNDMLLQQEWVEKIKPVYALLKFRLPYAEQFELEKGNTRNYLDGVVYTQPFCKSSSSETRLCVSGLDCRKRDWDILSYERKLFYHNSHVRRKVHRNPFTKDSKHIHYDIGLYNDYDSVHLTHVVLDYLRKIGQSEDEETTLKLLEYIVSNISPTRTLQDIRKN
jgi:hypothetical protein